MSDFKELQLRLSRAQKALVFSALLLLGSLAYISIVAPDTSEMNFLLLFVLAISSGTSIHSNRTIIELLQLLDRRFGETKERMAE